MLSDIMTFKNVSPMDEVKFVFLVRGGKSEPSLDQPKANQRDENSTIQTAR